MKRHLWLAAALVTLFFAAPARAENRFIVRSTLGANALTQLCLLQNCTVAATIDGTLSEVFLLTTPSTIDPTTFLNLLRNTPGIVDAELDQVISLVGGLNQSTAAVLDQSTAAVLDGNLQYAAFGHGTMVMGVIHLVAPNAQLLPLKAFHSDGTGYLSDILRAIYYAAQNNANIINMSFDFKTTSQELTNALDYANKLNIICAGSAGNDGAMETVYPAALQTDVMGVASTSDLDTRSTFSNFGNSIVWVAAPGEAIITTYPFSTYSAGWGTSFSAPFVSGGAALLRALRTDINQSLASAAIAHAQFVGTDMGNGRLDLLMALTALPLGSNSPDYSVAAAPSGTTITAGQAANFSVSAAPSGGFNQTVTWTCTGLPKESTCGIAPASSPMNGSAVATSTVSISTTEHSIALSGGSPRFAPPPLPLQILPLIITWLLAVLLLHKLRRSPRTRLLLGATTVLILATFCNSCSTGASSGPPPMQGTPTGTYTITMTGTSGSLSHSASFQLIVK